MTADTRTALRLGLVIIGLGGLFGAAVGAVYGTCREAAAALAQVMDEAEEPTP
jgi:hypothetical protein